MTATTVSFNAPYPHFGDVGVCGEPFCTRDNYDGHEYWDNAAGYARDLHADGSTCTHIGPCDSPTCHKRPEATTTPNVPVKPWAATLPTTPNRRKRFTAESDLHAWLEGLTGDWNRGVLRSPVINVYYRDNHRETVDLRAYASR